MSKVDVHQHIWTDPLLEALAGRRELPFVRRQDELTVLFLAGERPYVIDTASEAPARRAALLEGDGVARALLCPSSPVGLESLPREQALELIAAYHEGALALSDSFGVWGALALERPHPADVDQAIDRGCVGIALPAGALASVNAVADLYLVLARLEMVGAPLFVHPGPGVGRHRVTGGGASLTDPLWWPALTRYVAQMQEAWLAFQIAGRPEHPRLRVVFSMLAGLAPLQLERLDSRGGPPLNVRDRRIFYDTSSYGPGAVGAIAEVVGEGQLLYGSDRPVADPIDLERDAGLDWCAIDEATGRALRASPHELAGVA
jgi:6-methylsalicylate decarboxylase